MSEIMFDLPFQKVMTDGTVVLTYAGCVELAKRNKDFHQYFVESDPQFVKYNRFSDKPVVIYNGQPTTFTKEWMIPDEYKSFDVLEHCLDLVKDKPKQYRERVEREYNEFDKRELLDVLRFMKFFVDVLIEKNICWGVARGSSAASLLLYLLKVNRVDPVLYDIPLEEFLR